LLQAVFLQRIRQGIENGELKVENGAKRSKSAQYLGDWQADKFVLLLFSKFAEQ